jgi:hypothetical protein
MNTFYFPTSECNVSTACRGDEEKTRQAMHVQRDIAARSCNHCCSGIAVSITYSECGSLALGIRHAMRMRRIMMSSVACPATQNLSTLSHKRHDFR